MSAAEMDRPRPGDNQFGAGSPSAVQQVAVERFSMTDVAVDPGAWVPRLGDSSIPEGHAELIRGLYRLAAWVADHTDVPAPKVRARVFAGGESGWEAECRLVDRVALALGVEPEVDDGGDHYAAEAVFGPVKVSSTAIADAAMGRWRAMVSYSGTVQPDVAVADATVAGGAR